METKLTPKQALENLYELASPYNKPDLYSANNNYKIIDQALTELETIKEIGKKYNWDKITSEILNVKTDKKIRDLFYAAMCNIQEDYQKARKYEKQKQILEVLKNKKVNLWAIVMTKNVDEYNFSLVNKIAKPLTQEEFNLIKEWMK